MEEPGESLNSLILPYPGKQLLPESRKHFFSLKSGISDRYIYDLGLSTGEILYEGRGGMGFSTEPHILGLHDLMRMQYAESLIKEEFERNFKGKWGPAKFFRLRRDVNQELKGPNRRTMAQLYCLLACSGFRHKFDQHGNFKGEYFPHHLDTESIHINNKRLINSDFIIKKGSYKNLDTNLLTKKSLIYFHIPFPSRNQYKEDALDFFDHINSKGYDFLLTSRLITRGRADELLMDWSKNYFSIRAPLSDDKFSSSDIFITNF